jgi:hypothetical protein
VYQPSLFDNPVRIAPTDTHLVPQEKPRLSRQNQAILERLRRGSATNDELIRLARKYTARVSDLRAAGYDVRLVEHDHVTGITRYQLFEESR